MSTVVPSSVNDIWRVNVHSEALQLFFTHIRILGIEFLDHRDQRSSGQVCLSD